MKKLLTIATLILATFLIAPQSSIAQDSDRIKLTILDNSNEELERQFVATLRVAIRIDGVFTEVTAEECDQCFAVAIVPIETHNSRGVTNGIVVGWTLLFKGDGIAPFYLTSGVYSNGGSQDSLNRASNDLLETTKKEIVSFFERVSRPAQPAPKSVPAPKSRRTV